MHLRHPNPKKLNSRPACIVSPALGRRCVYPHTVQASKVRAVKRNDISSIRPTTHGPRLFFTESLGNHHRKMLPRVIRCRLLVAYSLSNNRLSSFKPTVVFHLNMSRHRPLADNNKQTHSGPEYLTHLSIRPCLPELDGCLRQSLASSPVILREAVPSGTRCNEQV